MKLVHRFVRVVVDARVKEELGQDYYIGRNCDEAIYRKGKADSPGTYYDRKVGHWFIRGDDLYIVTNDE